VEADKELGRDLAIDRPVTATNVREGKREFAAWQALDGDDSTYWATDDGKLPANLELDTEGGVDTNAVEIAEAAGMTGRVQEYKVEGMVNSDWKVLSQGTTIGDRKIDRFPRVTVWKVRLTISRASAYPAIRHFGIYMARSQ
jgi:alpha-L-fucosidase